MQKNFKKQEKILKVKSSPQGVPSLSFPLLLSLLPSLSLLLPPPLSLPLIVPLPHSECVPWKPPSLFCPILYFLGYQSTRIYQLCYNGPLCFRSTMMSTAWHGSVIRLRSSDTPESNLSVNERNCLGCLTLKLGLWRNP